MSLQKRKGEWYLPSSEVNAVPTALKSGPWKMFIINPGVIELWLQTVHASNVQLPRCCSLYTNFTRCNPRALPLEEPLQESHTLVLYQLADIKSRFCEIQKKGIERHEHWTHTSTHLHHEWAQRSFCWCIPNSTTWTAALPVEMRIYFYCCFCYARHACPSSKGLQMKSCSLAAILFSNFSAWYQWQGVSEVGVL